jgi:tRNA A-37 threonylcarbamoyl transferase component Bud32
MYQKIKLQSKKNEVYRIIDNEGSYILKEFSNVDSMNKELELLQLLNKKGLSTPNIIKIEEMNLCLEDLGDITLLDYYESMERINSHDCEVTIRKLCKWMKTYYSITSIYFNDSYIISDVNFRNFIIKENDIYGIDFEDSRVGNIEIDAGKIAAYGLTYTPMMTKWKIDFTNKFIDIFSIELNINKESIVQECNKELEKIKIRRNIGKNLRI